MTNSLTSKINDYCTYVSRAVKYYREEDYSGSAINCRKAAEAACKVIVYNAYPQKLADIKLSGKSLKELIVLLIHEGLTERKAINTLETLQIIGNKAAHDNPVGKDETIYAINALTLFNEYLFKEYLKIALPKSMDFNIGEKKATVVHKTEIIEKTIIQEKFNKEAEEQLLGEIRSIKEKSEVDATRYNDLKKEIELSHQKIDELFRQKQTEVIATAIPEKKISRNKLILLCFGLLILAAGLFYLFKKYPEKEPSEKLFILNRHSDSIYVAINKFQVMQDNPNMNFKIEERIFALINDQRVVNGLPVSIQYTDYKENGNASDSLLIDKAAKAGFDLIYYGNLYETSLNDSNILEIKGSTTKLKPQAIRDKKIKFRISSDSTFIKEVNDQVNLVPVFYTETCLKDKPSSKWLKVMQGLHSYSLENWLTVKNVVVDLKYGLGDFKGALSDIEQIVKQAPSANNICYKAILLGHLGQPDSSKKYFERALRLDSSSTVILFNYANICFERGDLGKAEELAKRAISTNPADHSCYFLMASVKTQQKQYGLAKSYALKAEGLFSGDIRNTIILANLYAFAENKKDSAEYFYSRALRKDSVNIEALTNLTNYYQSYYSSDPKYREKIDYLILKLKNLKVQNVMEANYSMGLVALERRDFKEALGHFEKVYAQGGRESNLLTSMAQAYYAVKRPEKALEFSKKALEVDSLNANSLTVHAYLLSYISPTDYKTCAYYFEKALKANPPTFLDIYQQYGTYLSRQGKTKESIGLALKGYKLFPGDVRLNSLLAYNYFELKDFYRAKPYFEKLLIRDPQNDTLMCDLAQCILRNFNGVKDDNFMYGASLMEKTISISPNNPSHLLVYAMYFLRGGNPDLAIKNYLLAKRYSDNAIVNEELEKLAYKKLTKQ